MQAGTARKGSARADLHTHSTASDGLLAPADLIHQAFERGLSILALTDHDTTAGLDEATRAGRDLGVRVIAGVELSTDVELGQLHMLGYGFSVNDTTLSRTLASLRSSREDRARLILDRLSAVGIEIDAETIRPARPGESIGRPHVARAMVEGGHVESVREAFDRYIGEGQAAYVASRRLTPEAAVRLIVAAGGVPVMAHPYSFPAFRERLPALIEAGLQGIEVYYGEYTEEQQKELAGLAESHGLLTTGGSDFHGVSGPEARNLGGTSLPEPALERFLQRLDARPGRAD